MSPKPLGKGKLGPTQPSLRGLALEGNSLDLISGDYSGHVATFLLGRLTQIGNIIASRLTGGACTSSGVGDVIYGGDGEE
ncbi:hypothetical protein Tco_0585263 [Tanacetum coccineum]